MSIYHTRSLALLGYMPTRSKAAGEVLDNRGRERGIRWAPAVHDWYTLNGAVDILRRYSNGDDPLDIEEIGEPRDLVAEAMLLLMYENQGVCHWAVNLDGSDDPPVMVAIEPEVRGAWIPAAARFSEFIYCRIWDHLAAEVCCGAQEQGLASTDYEKLTKRFIQEPNTYGWPGDRNYRFTTPWGRILIWESAAGGVDWHLFGNSPAATNELLGAVWDLGSLAETLYGLGDFGTKCIDEKRRSR